MADQFLDGKTMKLAKNGSNVVILHFFYDTSFCLVLLFFVL